MMREDTKKVFDAICKLPDISKFILVGGTALAIKTGHRLSEDLDFCVTTTKLDKAVVNRVIKELSKDFTIQHNTDIAQQELFENDGLDLLDHHQDWLVDNVKVTFFTIGTNDEERALLSRQELDTFNHLHSMSLDGLFITKCLVLCDRIKSRDIFDLWWMIKHADHKIEDVFNTIQSVRPHLTYDSIRYRLLDWSLPLTDEGLEAMSPVSFDTVRNEMREMVGELEVLMTREISQKYMRPK